MYLCITSFDLSYAFGNLITFPSSVNECLLSSDDDGCRKRGLPTSPPLRTITVNNIYTIFRCPVCLSPTISLSLSLSSLSLPFSSQPKSPTYSAATTTVCLPPPAPARARSELARAPIPSPFQFSLEVGGRERGGLKTLAAPSFLASRKQRASGLFMGSVMNV